MDTGVLGDISLNMGPQDTTVQSTIIDFLTLDPALYQDIDPTFPSYHHSQSSEESLATLSSYSTSPSQLSSTVQTLDESPWEPDANSWKTINTQDDDISLQQLLGLQNRLARLRRSLLGGQHTEEDIEDIYRSSETLTNILGSVKVPSSSLFLSQHETLEPSDSGLCGGLILLILSSYYALIHAYELLRVLLEEEIRQDTNNTSNAISASTPPDARSSNSEKKNKTHESRASVPGISVGGLRLAMSRKAAAEINLHLLAQTVHHLKESMQGYVSRMSRMKRRAGTHTYKGLDRDKEWDQRQSNDMANSAGAGESCVTITDLAEVALCELRRREEMLVSRLGGTPFSGLGMFDER